MFLAFESITMQISEDNAIRYAASSAEALSAHIKREIDIISLAAKNDAVIAWFLDEFDEQKKAHAFSVFSSIINQLYSYNLYVGVMSSLNEYRAEIEIGAGGIHPIAVLSPDEPMDAWFFDCINSEMEYRITVDIDHIMQRKRVWLDYKVEFEGLPLGVICTGLEFSHVISEIFSQYSQNNIRGLIIDNNGTIHMDSSLMDDNEFLFQEYESTFYEEFSDVTMINAIESHLQEADGLWRERGEPTVHTLTSGQYRIMTIAPINHTDWSVVLLLNTVTLLDTRYFLPIMITILVMMIAFAVAISIMNYRILFRPLSKLDESLSTLNEHSAEGIFGAERDDELGHLSNTIQDLFNKANIDPLTGLYNRRFMDSCMERIMGLLSRTDGMLSVLMLDIDFFKRFNDTYGHEAGDKCLQSVARALSHSVSRVTDIVVRYGGEEFTVILPNTDSDGAAMFAEKLLQNVRDLEIPHENNDAAEYVTVSIGVTTGRVDHRQDLGMYLKRADEALYSSKETGRNKYTYLNF